MRIRAGKVAVLAAALMALPGVTPAAQATSPGQNGLLAFDPGGYTIATLDPSGNGVADYLPTGARDGDAAWTANGNRIFFARTLFSGGSEIVSVHVADKRLREYPPISFSEVYAQPWPLPGGGFVFARGPQFGTR